MINILYKKTFSTYSNSVSLDVHAASRRPRDTQLLFSVLFRLEITSRMAPRAIFRAFRPIYNEDSETTASSEKIYTYDQQNITVNLEDRPLVSPFRLQNVAAASRKTASEAITIIFHDMS